MKVLILDDNYSVVEILKTNLEMQFDFMEIYATTDVEKALGVVDSHTIDICFLDVRMPKMDGYDFMRQSNGKLKQIVFITGIGDKEEKLTKEEKQKSVFFEKPIPMKRIMDFTNDAMRNWMLKDIIRNLEETRDYCAQFRH